MPLEIDPKALPPTSSRREFLTLGGLLVAGAIEPRRLLAAAGARAGPRTDVYARDVEFLLDELEKKAGRFFELKAIDWTAVRAQFRGEVKKVRSDAEHVSLSRRLVARLRDGHAAIVDLKVKMPDESKGRRFTGPRVLLVTIGEKVYVRSAFKTAAARGIRPGMEVLRIDRVPARRWLDERVEQMRDENGFSTSHGALYAACHQGLADWEGTPITFDLAQGKRKARITIRRQGGPNYAPIGPVFPPPDLEVVGRQSYGKTTSGYGYIHLRNVPGELPQELDRMLAGIGDVPGLVLDCRANGGGGCDHEAVFARFLAPDERWRQYRGAGKRPFRGPLVVIIDAGVRSAGETVAGMLKEDGRAYMIGDSPTAGSSSQKEKVAVPSGLFAVYFSVASNKARFNDGRGIEGVGVPPHEVVPYDPAELLEGVDTQIRRAEEILRAGIPKDKVPYSSA